MTSVTVCIECIGLNLQPTGNKCSGFILRFDNRCALITVAHAFLVKVSGSWMLQCGVENGKAKLWPLNDIKIIPHADIAISVLPSDIEINYLMQNPRNGSMEILSKQFYISSLNEKPIIGNRYNFVGFPKYEYDPHLNHYITDPSWELDMIFSEYNAVENAYRFKLADEFKGDEYYQGCSGAPIADDSGRIVAIVKGRPIKASGIILGVPLAKYPLLNLISEVFDR